MRLYVFLPRRLRDDGEMTAILYPVAANAEAALSQPLGRAARAREAQRLAGEAVCFEAEPVGPAFATREAALEAYAGRVEDDRPGHLLTLPPEDRYCRLVETVVAEGGRPAAAGPLRPAYAEGRRWPAPPPPPRTAWRLSISYWRVASAERPVEAPQARQVRRGKARDLDRDTLNAIARQPLRAVEPQQPLDIGLFETRLPESPHIVVPDE